MSAAGSAEEGSTEEVRHVLEDRARTLARAPEPDEVEDGATGMLVMRLAGERWAVPVASVKEIEDLDELTALPGIPDLWAGLVNLRGTVYPVLALARYLELGGTEAAEGAQVVVLAAAGMEVALLVDAVDEIRRVAPPDVSPLLVDGRAGRSEAFHRVTADMVSVLDPEALLAAPSLVVEQEAA